MKSWIGCAVIGFSTFLFLAWATPARANFITLTDLNSTATFNTDGMPQPAGQTSWVVDGTNQLTDQWFWFRIGNTAEQSLDSLPQTGQSINDTNFNPGNDQVSTQYTGSSLNGTPVRITTTYQLTGGLPGSGTSDIGETIKIDNISDIAYDFHFFEYVDFDLNGTPSGDTVRIIAPLYNTAIQSAGAASLTETVTSPSPSEWEANFSPNTLNKLNDGVPDTLTNVAGPLGPGNVTWAFEWDFSLNPGASFIISKDKNFVVPEPSTTFAALAVVAGLALVRRRRTA